MLLWYNVYIIKHRFYGWYKMEFDLDNLSNEELECQLRLEFLYYEENLLKLCSVIRKTIPKKMYYRLLSKLYRIRKTP